LSYSEGEVTPIIVKKNGTLWCLATSKPLENLIEREHTEK